MREDAEDRIGQKGGSDIIFNLQFKRQHAHCLPNKNLPKGNTRAPFLTIPFLHVMKNGLFILWRYKKKFVSGSLFKPRTFCFKFKFMDCIC